LVDFMTNQQRSRAMSRVRGKETRIELLVRSLLHRKGFRYKNNVLTLPGRPDIVLPKYKAAVFVHGCFWHGHPGCKLSRLPGSREEFWEQKISNTSLRDKEKIAELLSIGWRTAVVWQCVLNNRESVSKTIDVLANWIIYGDNWLEIPNRG